MSEPWYDDETIGVVEPGSDIYFSARDGVFYFGDEAEQLNGPYTTKQEAETALDIYVAHL
jgi:hypothetical protein